MKLIEAKQAKEFASTFLADKILQASVNAVVDNCPGFELVRCKECGAYNTDGCAEGFGWCEGFDRGMMDNDYCSHGGRRTDG